MIRRWAILLATFERVQILDKTDELAAMILQSDIADEYRKCYNRLKIDKESQRKIQAFLKIKEHL